MTGRHKLTGKGPPAPDTTPNSMAGVFPDKTNQALSTAILSDIYTPVGFDAAAPLVLSGGQAKVNGGAAGGNVSFSPGSTLQLSLMSSSAYSTPTSMTGTLGGVAFSFNVVTISNPSGAPPIVSPSGAYDGTEASGGTPPSDPTRSTFKPIMQFWDLDKTTFTGDYVVGVWADCKGGLDANGVQFYVHGTTFNVTSPTLYVDTDPRGNYRARYGYWITLRASQFTGFAGGAPTARVYAMATPASGGQARVIGYDADVTPMVLYPRAALNDSTYPVRADGAGGAYTTIRLAMAAAAAAGKKNPLIQIQQTGLFWELEDGTWTTVADGKGYCDIRCAAGVTATVGRATMPAAPTKALWTWDPRWANVRFGPGITFDCRNVNTIRTTTQTAYPTFHGAIVTNSIGTRDTLYYFKGRAPGLSGIDSGGTGTNLRFLDCDLYYQEGLGYSNKWQGNHVYRSIGGVRTGIKFLANCYERETDCRFYTPPINAFSIQKTGGGGTIEKVGTTLVLKNGAVTLFTYQLSDDPASTFYNTDAIADHINANYAAAGFSATKLDNTRNSLSLFPNGTGGPIALTAAASNMITQFDIHSELMQVASWMIQQTKENIAIVDYTTHKCFYSTAPWNWSFSFDTAIVNVLMGDPLTECFSSPCGGWSHMIMKNSFLGGLQIYNNVSNDAYCEINQCMISYLYGDDVASAGQWYSNLKFINTVIGHMAPNGGAGNLMPNGTGSSGNTQLAAYNDVYNYFVDALNNNYLPSATATGNQKSKILDFDGLHTARSATDTVTPWSKNATLPTWRVP